MTRRALLPLLAAALAASCDDPVRPGDVAGTYVLRSIAGAALPAVAYTSPGFSSRVVADTLRLAADGTGSLARTAVYEPPAPAAGTTYAYTRPVRYSLTGGRVELEVVCGPNELCTAPPHLVARVEGRGLVVERRLTEVVPQRYERAGP